MPLLCHLSFPNNHFSSLNLNRWRKCNACRLNLDCRIDNLKWHPLIWTLVYLYDLDWRSLKNIYSLNSSIPHFYSLCGNRNSSILPAYSFVVIPSFPQSTFSLRLSFHFCHHRFFAQTWFWTPLHAADKHLDNFHPHSHSHSCFRKVGSPISDLSLFFFFFNIFCWM